MTYLTQDAIRQSPALFARVRMCAAEQGAPEPERWAQDHRDQVAVTPGWDAKWASALAGANPPADPGAAEDVITDLDILARVQQLMGAP
jgi:hypothetical protein